MCLCGENGAAKETEVGFLVLVVQTVALFTKNLRGSFDGFFLIEFNAQHAALVLPVMDDADVLILIFFRARIVATAAISPGSSAMSMVMA